MPAEHPYAHTLPTGTVLHISHATVEDLPAIAALEAEVYDEDAAWGLDDYAEHFAEPGSHYLLCETPDGRLIAYAVAGVEDDVAHIIAITVAESHRRCKVGQFALEQLLLWAATTDAVDVVLEVREDNLPAIALYERFGFVHGSRELDLYGPGVHALMMRRPIQ